MRPWTADTPVDGRRVALCQREDPEQDGVCRLMDSTAITDSAGFFEFQDVEEGIYLILYDSGLGDFDKTMDQWSGRLMRLGDERWLAEFLEIKDLDEWVSHRVPEGISLSPHYAWITSYCILTLLVDESPFVVSHDMKTARDQGQLRCLLVEVEANNITRIEFDSVYFSG